GRLVQAVPKQEKPKRRSKAPPHSTPNPKQRAKAEPWSALALFRRLLCVRFVSVVSWFCQLPDGEYAFDAVPAGPSTTPRGFDMSSRTGCGKSHTVVLPARSVAISRMKNVEPTSSGARQR